MEIKWKQQLIIPWEITDISGKLSLPGLGQLLINTATYHADRLGFGYNELKDQNLNWVLFRMNIELIRRPEWHEPVTLTTWPTGISGIAGLREFVMTDEKDNIICNASSEWLIIDLSTRRPKRLKQYESILKYNLPEKAFTRTSPVANTKGEFSTLFTHTIRHSDMDLNGHATARRYFDWLDDGLYQVLNDYELDMIQITFFNETYLGDTIILQVDDTKTTLRGVRQSDNKVAFMAVVKIIE